MSHIKISSNGGDWGYRVSHGEPLAQLIKLSNRGLVGNDRYALIKRAGHEFVEQMEKLAIKPGDIPIHEIALGASEFYGSNRNGDCFKEAECRKHHHTFMKFARSFRNHRNKDASISYGRPQLSRYNDDMHRIELVTFLNGNKEAADRNGGFVADKELEKLARGEDLPRSMACFPPGTPVLRADWSEHPIEKLSPGQLVITHHGNTGVVEQIMHRQYDGDLVRFRASGLPDDVVCTANHKVWTRPTVKGKAAVCPVCGRQFKSLMCHLHQQHDPQHQHAYRDYGRYAEGWTPADQLALGDFVRTPFDESVTEKGDPIYAELLGFYLSEGNTFHRPKRPSGDGVDFSFSSKERDLAARVGELLTQLGYTRIYFYDRKNNVRLVRVISPALAEKLEADAGRYSWGKRLAARFMTWSPPVQMKLFAAFMDGDGHFHKLHQSLIATTVSRPLAFQLAAICWRNGIPARIHTLKPKTDKKRLAYTVHVQKSHVEEIPCRKSAGFQYALAVRPLGHMRHQVAGNTWTGTTSALFAYVEHGFVYRRVVRCSKEAYSGPVHNISVSVDSSYVVNGVGVSNCKVAYDVCTACGNRARNRSEYCEEKQAGGNCSRLGCKINLTKMADDGFLQSVYNPNPVWFDISMVGRNADPTAWAAKADWLTKAASDFSGSVGGSELASGLGVVAPLNVVLYDEMPLGVWEQFVTEQVKLACGLAVIEQRLSSGEIPPSRLRGVLLTAQNSVNLSPLDKLGSSKMAAALGALAREQTILPLSAFAAMTNRGALTKIAALIMPGIYTRLLADGSLQSLVENNRFAPSWVMPTSAHSAWAKTAGCSLQAGRLEEENLRSILRQLPLPKLLIQPNEKLAFSREAKELAADYAIYKLAALHRMLETSSQLAEAAVAAVGMDYVQ